MVELLVIVLPLAIALCVLGVILDSKRKLRLPGLKWDRRMMVIDITRASADRPGCACDLTLRHSGEGRNPE